MNHSPLQRTTILYVGLCIFVWSLIPEFAKITKSTLDNHQYLFFSSIMSFLTILAISITSKSIHEAFSYSGRTVLWLFFLGFLNFIYYLLLYYGYQNANGLEVLVIQYLWPIFIVLLSIPLLREKLTKYRIAAAALGFCGIFIIITHGNLQHFNPGNTGTLFWVMLGTFSFALFSVLGKLTTVNPINAVMLYFFSAVIYSIISVYTFSEFIIPTPQDWISILVNGIFLNGLSYILWIKALKSAPASAIAPFIFITPVLSALFMIIFFDEPLHGSYIIGLLAVIISGLFNSIFDK